MCHLLVLGYNNWHGQKFFSKCIFVKDTQWAIRFVPQMQNSQTILYFNYTTHHIIFILDLRVQLMLLEAWRALCASYHSLVIPEHALCGKLLWKMGKLLTVGYTVIESISIELKEQMIDWLVCIQST